MQLAIKVLKCCEFDSREAIKTRVECCLGRRGEERHRGARQGLVGEEEGKEVTISDTLGFSRTLWGNCHCVPMIVLVWGCNAWDDSARVKD
jgi:hypothetical protein